jgi:hypothetical protein
MFHTLECNAEIEKVIDKLENAMEKRVPILVLYSKFVKHEAWRELQQLSQQTDILRAIFRSHMNYIVTNELIEKCKNKPLWQEQLKKKVQHWDFFRLFFCLCVYSF